MSAPRPAPEAEHLERLDQEELLELHNQLLRGDPDARAKIADRVFIPLLHTMGRLNPRHSRGSILQEATEDALISYLNHPEQYDPEKRGLFGYLVMSASGDLKNALAKDRRTRKHEFSVGNMFEIDGVATAAAMRALGRRQGRRTPKTPTMAEQEGDRDRNDD